MHEVHVRGLPPWLGPAPLLGEGAWTVARSDVRVDWVAQLMTAEAADLEARLRRLVIAGHPVEVEVNPALRRTAQRRARLEDARRRRDTTAGFDRRECRYDEEGRWSLTPSNLALELGERAAGHPVLDLGCGVGGNTIGFARAGARVVAVERDPRRLGHARHNARVYGVEDRVEFVEGDAMSLLERYPGHLAFVDPPWGGEARAQSTSLSALPLLESTLARRPRPARVWAKVPVSFALDQAPPCEVEAVFGRAEGDRRWIKFLWLRFSL